MKMLYLNHNVIGSGTWQRASNFARALARRGHAITVVTTHPTARGGFTERELDGVRVLEAPDLWWGPARTGWDPWNTLRRVLRLRNERFDLVHAFDGRPAVSIPAMLISRRAGVPLFMDWADWWGRGGRIQERSGWPVRTFFSPIETWFEESFRTRAVATTVISAALRERSVGLGVDPGRILEIPNGCDPEGVRKLPREEARAALGLPADVPLVAHLGTLTPPEMDFLAMALRKVAERVAGFRVVLIGRPGARPPADLVASGSIRVTGFVNDLAMNQWLAAADACLVVLPDTISSRARWPGKVNDYFSAARATVITDVGAAARLVRDQRLGWVTAPTPESFANGICAALARPFEAAAAGARARHLAEHELAWRFLAERLEHFYFLHASAQGGGRAVSSA